MTNLERFNEAYARNLETAVRSKPEKYAYGLELVPSTAAKMAKAFERGDYNKDGIAIKMTCKELGIPYTYAGINAFIAGGAA